MTYIFVAFCALSSVFPAILFPGSILRAVVCMTENTDEWTLITRNHKLCRRRKTSSVQNGHSSNAVYVLRTSTNSLASKTNAIPSLAVSDVKFDKQLSEAVNHLACSGFAADVLDLIQAALSVNSDASQESIDVVCFGLGNFQTCYIARYQLALLEILRSKLLVRRCSIYDPIFTQEETDWLSANSYDLLAENGNCLNTPVCESSTHRTLYYMPHCERIFYHNVLYSNWSTAQLQRVVIFGNSVSKLADQFPDGVSNLLCFKMAAPALHELKLPHFASLNDAFNDTSVNAFVTDRISRESWAYKLQNDPPTRDSAEDL